MKLGLSQRALGIGLLLFIGVGFVQARIDQRRSQSENPMVAELSPGLRFAHAALGSFRSWVVNALWLRQAHLEEQGRNGEAAQVADLILTTAPRFEGAWSFQAYRLAFDLVADTRGPLERFRWVTRAIDLLRRRGLRQLPASSELHSVLAYLFWFKLGGGDNPFEPPVDPSQADYQLFFAARWDPVLGSPDSGTLQRVAEVGRQAESLDDEEVFEATDEQLEEFGEALKTLSKSARDRFRFVLLRDRFNMDPELMLELTDRLGPLDWRQPGSHAIYWAVRGRLRKAGIVDLADPETSQVMTRTLEIDDHVYSGLSQLLRHGHAFRSTDGRWRSAPEPRMLDAFRTARFQGRTFESGSDTDRAQYIANVDQAIFRAHLSGEDVCAANLLQESGLDGSIEERLEALALRHVETYEKPRDGVIGLCVVGFRYAYAEGGTMGAQRWFSTVERTIETLSAGPLSASGTFDINQLFIEAGSQFFSSPRIPFVEKERAWFFVPSALRESLTPDTLQDLLVYARERAGGRKVDQVLPGLTGLIARSKP